MQKPEGDRGGAGGMEAEEESTERLVDELKRAMARKDLPAAESCCRKSASQPSAPPGGAPCSSIPYPSHPAPTSDPP